MESQKSPNMDVFKRRAFDICLAVYRLTGVFPRNEVVSNQLREASGQIAASLAAGRINDTILKIEEIKIFLGIARSQNWASPMNFDLISNAYCLLAKALLAGSVGSEEKKEKVILVQKKNAIPPPGERKNNENAVASPGENIRRQKMIIDFFNEKGEATVPQLSRIFNNVSERTIRTDIGELISQKIIVKNGARRGARYFLKK